MEKHKIKILIECEPPINDESAEEYLRRIEREIKNDVIFRETNKKIIRIGY